MTEPQETTLITSSTLTNCVALADTGGAHGMPRATCAHLLWLLFGLACLSHVRLGSTHGEGMQQQQQQQHCTAAGTVLAVSQRLLESIGSFAPLLLLCCCRQHASTSTMPAAGAGAGAAGLMLQPRSRNMIAYSERKYYWSHGLSGGGADEK